MPIPGIPESSRSKVYRRICDQLRTDPVIGGRCEWIFWDGSRKDVTNVAADRPTVVLYPTQGPVQMTAADAFGGPLNINIEITIPVTSPDATTCLDLWQAIELALYPHQSRDKQFTFEQQLRDAGAEFGEVMFPQPATISARVTADGGFAGIFDCAGVMSITIQRAINS